MTFYLYISLIYTTIYTTNNFSSSEDINTDLSEAIKATFKSKAITIIVDEEVENELLSAEMKAESDTRLNEPIINYDIAKYSIKLLHKKYSV